MRFICRSSAWQMLLLNTSQWEWVWIFLPGDDVALSSWLSSSGRWKPQKADGAWCGSIIDLHEHKQENRFTANTENVSTAGKMSEMEELLLRTAFGQIAVVVKSQLGHRLTCVCVFTLLCFSSRTSSSVWWLYWSASEFQTRWVFLQSLLHLLGIERSLVSLLQSHCRY